MACRACRALNAGAGGRGESRVRGRYVWRRGIGETPQMGVKREGSEVCSERRWSGICQVGCEKQVNDNVSLKLLGIEKSNCCERYRPFWL